MRRAVLLLWLGALASAGERAFLETGTPRDTYFVHEPIRVTLRIGLDRNSAVQIFPRSFDVPVQVHAPWLDTLPGTILRARAEGGLSLVLNGKATAAPEGERRGPCTVVEVEQTLLPTRPGELVLAAPSLRFAFATRFKEDFVHGRVPVDRRDETVSGAPLTLRIRPLPAEGRPPGFTGAVGTFTVSAEAAPRTVDSGAILKLTLRIEGEGNLELFETPRLDDLARFHVYGVIDDKQEQRRTITYDVAPLGAGVKEVPAVAFSFFDPRAAAYRTVHTEPIPITVRGDAEQPPPPAAPARDWVPLLAGAALVVVALAAAGLLARRRGREESDAAAAFHARAGTDLAEAFTGCLAAHLKCPAASVISPDLEARLEAAGVPRDLAARCAALLESLVATRYGGAPDDRAAAEASDLVEALEAVAADRG